MPLGRTVAGPFPATNALTRAGSRRSEPQHTMQGALLPDAPVRQRNGEMVLQVGTHARQVLDRRNPQLPQGVLVADAGEHQQLGRIDRAARNDHFSPRARLPQGASA